MIQKRLFIISLSITLTVIFLGFVFFSTGCVKSNTPTNYTTVSLPDSLIIKTLEDNGYHPEKTAQRVWRIVKREIQINVFTKKEVIDYCNEMLGVVKDITYYDFFSLIDRYISLYDDGNPIASQAVVIGVVLLEDQFSEISNLTIRLVPDDAKVVSDLLTYIRDETEKM